MLVGFLGEAKALRDVSPADADAYLAWLKQQFAPATVSRTFRRARQFFRAAVRARLLAANPFDGIATPGEVNASKQVFVSIEDTLKVIEECPSLDLRVIVALARFGGIRVPSELNIAWVDVLWDKNRMRIASPKTEHHEGKAERWVPIFPELRPYLEEAFEAAAEGAVYVIANERYRDNPSLRWNLTRAARRAGLNPWPKPFVNLRSSRETELAEKFPLHVVVAWLGNTQAIAHKHYLMNFDDQNR